MFNQKNWSVQQEIEKRAQKESLVAWAAQDTSPILPKFEKSAKVELTSGVWNLVKNSIYQFRP